MQRNTALLFIVALVAVNICTPANLEAKIVKDSSISVVQRRPVLKALRLEVLPVFGVALNESLTTHMFVGGTLNFHILEQLFIGGSYQYYFGKNSKLSQDVQADYEVFPERRLMKWAAFGHVGWAPIYGKFSLFGATIVHFDVYFFGGAGVTKTNSVHVTGIFGVGTRWFINKFMSFNWEIRDQLYRETFAAGKSFVNNVVFQLGFTVFIPFGFKYKQLR